MAHLKISISKIILTLTVIDNQRNSVIKQSLFYTFFYISDNNSVSPAILANISYETNGIGKPYFSLNM